MLSTASTNLSFLYFLVCIRVFLCMCTVSFFFFFFWAVFSFRLTLWNTYRRANMSKQTNTPTLHYLLIVTTATVCVLCCVVLCCVVLCCVVLVTNRFHFFNF